MTVIKLFDTVVLINILQVIDFEALLMKICYVKKFKKKQEKITEVGSFVE